MTTKAQVQIRWLIRRDMAEVLEIERHSFEFAWTEEDFLCSLRQRNCIGMIAESAGEILGFMVYELHKDNLKIANFAVHQSFRRQGVGTAMVNRLVDKLSQQRRKRIVLELRETNMQAALFFRSQRFVAYAVLRGFYEDTGEDAYSMRFSLNAADEVCHPYIPTNRIVL